ncbi:MAG: hypothetical protein LBJ91_04820 [Clostridiales Family XIII bacterium]|nr:hypothetical protein [Clostridiales Family XIII bacterium]
MKMKSIRKSRIARALPLAALALILVLGSFTLASADEEKDDRVQDGNLNDPAKAAITKILQMPDGTTTPDHTYTFTIAAISGPTDYAKPPVIAPTQAAFDSNSEATSTSGGIKTLHYQTGDILDGVTWPESGIYTYEVTESQTNNVDANTTVYNNSESVKEDLDYSKAKYEIQVYVAWDEDENELFVRYVKAHRTVDDKGVAAENNTGNKVNAAPDAGASDDSIGHDFSGMDFTNTFVRTNIKDFDEDDGLINNTSTGALYIEEKIGGTSTGAIEYADPNHPFLVTVTLAKPSLVTQAAFDAYLVDSTGAKVTNPVTSYSSITVEGQQVDTNKYIFSDKTAQGVKLRDGERLVFVNLPVGTTYSAIQEDTSNYTVKLRVQYNNDTILDSTSSGKGEGISTSYAGAAAMVGENVVNSAVFSSSYGLPVPGGVFVDNLPYVMLIVLVAAGLAAYVFSRSRRRRRGAR